MKLSASDRRTLPIALAFLAPALAVFTVFQFVPMLWTFVLSFQRYSAFTGESAFIGWENYHRLLTDQSFRQALTNSFLYLCVVPVIMALSLALAMLVEPSLPGMSFFRAAFYLPVVTMMVVVALSWKFLFDTDFGVINGLIRAAGLGDGIPWLTDRRYALWTVMSVTLWKGLGYYMVMFLVGLKGIPRELVEAATIDGAGRFQVFRHVKLPALWPVLSLASVLSAISALQVFEEIYLMTAGRIGTSTVVLRIFEVGIGSGSSMEMGYASAMGVVLFAILLVFSAVAINLMERAWAS